MTITKESQPNDIYQLAEDARRFTRKNSKSNGGDVSGQMTLVAGLDRVRGVAVQRANAANVRLRKQAVGATAISFGVGVAMGCWLALSQRHSWVRA